ncbi:MAG: hypothetical protein ABSG65_12010 [Bryobacteraceae bacterium]|jgi:hypothetical protein
MRKLITTGFFLGLLSLTALAADVTGKWTAQMTGPGGQTREQTFNFKVDGNTLTGTVSGRQGDMEISDGKIDGDSISFTQTMEFNGNTVKIVYKGTISGDTIKFTREREGGGGGQGRKGGPMEFIAKRAS